ncbi:MAG: HD domain-containing protein [Lachnospiraceae bacterium]|nr:HD domain-containing protein [Lachnospiraceae bacterium]
MLELMQKHQLNIMLCLSSMCLIVGFFAMLTKSLPPKRKRSIAILEFSAAILLYSDRLAYIYHGDQSVNGYWMVRITNFLVFFLTVSVVHSFNIYLTDVCRNEVGLTNVPKRLTAVEAICFFGWIMVVISQFTGLYYTFDENNAYQRGPGFLICYIVPFLALFLQMSVILQYVRRLSKKISLPLVFFTVIPMIASLVQAKFYGVSLTNMSIVGMGVVLYVFAILEMNDILESAQRRRLDEANYKHLSIRRSFEQTVKAVARALDSRDKYTKGHSFRVAEYSSRIAQAYGMDDRDCFRVYNSAMLHDIGKIKIPESIIGSAGHLTDAEEAELRKHPVLGGEILSEVEEIPYLRTAALYHHERYDGKGYPEGRKGEEIPIIARIVAVANAYDEMTSHKSSREPYAQGKVREALLSASGREFDPEIVKIMIDMIDKDTDYVMRETDDDIVEVDDRNDLTMVNKMHFEIYKEQVSDGIRIEREFMKIRFETCPDAGYDRKKSLPAIILFDSFDRCVHRNERSIRDQRYFEYGEIWMDGHTICTKAREIKTDIRKKKSEDGIAYNDWIPFEIEAVSIKDHVKLKISSPYIFADVTVALPDATRFVFLGMSGEHCSIRNVSVKKISLVSGEDQIPRIAPEVNYFTRKDGNIPNIEINGYREESTKGIPVADGMRILFRSQSLPVADLVHHCAYILLFTSDDGEVNGKNYAEYACIRLDGDDATDMGQAENKLTVHKNEEFEGWDEFKAINRRGLDYEVTFSRKKNKIYFYTENAGISIECETIVPKDKDNVYVALTGNLCAIMDIRIR